MHMQLVARMKPVSWSTLILASWQRRQRRSTFQLSRLSRRLQKLPQEQQMSYFSLVGIWHKIISINNSYIMVLLLTIFPRHLQCRLIVTNRMLNTQTTRSTAIDRLVTATSTTTTHSCHSHLQLVRRFCRTAVAVAMVFPPTNRGKYPNHVSTFSMT